MNKNNQIEKEVYEIGLGEVVFILCIIASLMTSCKTLEQKCAETFPSEIMQVVKEVRTTELIELPEMVLEYQDTTECLPSVVPYTITKTVIKIIPPKTIVHEKVRLDTVIQYKDQPKVNYLSAELKNAKAHLAKSKSKANRWIGNFIGLAMATMVIVFLAVAAVIGRIKKKSVF